MGLRRNIGRLSAWLQGGRDDSDLRRDLHAARAEIDALRSDIAQLRLYGSAPDYFHDFLAVWNKSVDHFMANPKFISAYQRGMDSGHAIGRPRGAKDDIHIEWRIHTCVWAGLHASKLPGDFVECGVNTGIMSLAVCEYVDFNRLDKTFWLFDTYEGIPAGQLTVAEEGAGRLDEAKHYFACYDIAKTNFSPWPRARLVKGMVPDTLATVQIDSVAYLCIDMNIVAPEKAALAYFWPRMVRGGVVIFDDYGWKQCRLQKEAHDEWAKREGVEILLLPTGQGMLIKP